MTLTIIEDLRLALLENYVKDINEYEYSGRTPCNAYTFNTIGPVGKVDR